MLSSNNTIQLALHKFRTCFVTDIFMDTLFFNITSVQRPKQIRKGKLL